MASPFRATKKTLTNGPQGLIRFGSHAEILHAIGFKLTAVAEGTKGWLYDNWVDLEQDLDALKKLITKYPDRAIGIQLHAQLLAIDIDVNNRNATSVIFQVLSEKIGATGTLLKRIGNPDRCATLVRSIKPINTFKIRIQDPDGAIHEVEILGHGKQLVVFNRHEETGKEYFYEGQSPLDIKHVDELAQVEDAGQIVDLAREAVARLGDGWKIVESSNDSSHTFTTMGNDQDPNALNSSDVPSQFTDREVCSFLSEIIPPDHLDYDFVRNVGMALCHHSDGSDEFFNHWVEWSSQSPHHDIRHMCKWWDGFKKPRRGRAITAATLRMYANQVRETQKLNHSVETFRKAEAQINNFKDEQSLLTHIPTLAMLPLVPHYESALITLVYDKIKELSERDPGIKNIEKLFNADKAERSKSNAKNPRLLFVEGIEQGIWGVRAYFNQDRKVCLEDASKGHLENCILDSEAGENCLINLFRLQFKQLLDPAGLHVISSGISAGAHHLPTYNTGKRWVALGNDRYAVDLGDRDHSVIYVSPGSYTVGKQGEARHIRNGLERPFLGAIDNAVGNLNLLWKYVSVSEEGKEIIITWLLEVCRSDTPYPILVLVGPKGSAKTSFMRVLLDVVARMALDLGTPPVSDRDLRASAADNPIVLIDNVTHFNREMFVTLCQLCTGATDQERKMKSNHKTARANIKTPSAFNCISIPKMPPDTIERLMVVETQLPPERQTEQNLEVEYKRDLPIIQAGFLTHFAKCLEELPNVPLSSLPRMADACVLGQASLNVRRIDKRFSELLATSSRKLNGDQFEGEPVLVELQRFMLSRGTTNRHETTATDLWDRLTHSKFPHSRDYRVPWPKTGQSMLGLFDRNEQLLHEQGVEFERIKGSRPRLVKFWLNDNAPADYQPEKDPDTFDEMEDEVIEDDFPDLDF